MNSSDYELHGQVAAQLGAPWPARVDLWSAQMRYVAIAVGGCNVLIKVPRKEKYRSNIWDHAGGMLLVEEIGCRVTTEGNPVDCGLGRRLSGCYGWFGASVYPCAMWRPSELPERRRSIKLRFSL